MRRDFRGSQPPETGPGEFVIFGFNTDVKHADTVYHVQSEAREHELLLQTQIFVKGRCVGTRATSYIPPPDQPHFSEEHMQEVLKDQHRYFVAAVREGRIDAEFPEAAAAKRGVADAAAVAAPPVAAPSTMLDDLADFLAATAVVPAEFSLTAFGSVIGKGLELNCLPPQAAPGGSTVIVFVQVSDDEGPAAGAQLTCRITSSRGPAAYAYSASGIDGVAEVDVHLDELDLATAALLIQATHGGKSVSRKFQLRQK